MRISSQLLHSTLSTGRWPVTRSAAFREGASRIILMCRIRNLWIAVLGTLWISSAGCQQFGQPLPGGSTTVQGIPQGMVGTPPTSPSGTNGGYSPPTAGNAAPSMPTPGAMVVRGQDPGSTIPPSLTSPPPSTGGTLPSPATAPPPYPGPPVEAIPPSFLSIGPDGTPTFDSTVPTYEPPIREAPVDIYATEARTGRFMIGGAVNSDAGLTGQIVVSEQNFDLLRFPRSWDDILDGRAFRGAGQTFRLEAMPGTVFQRYMVTWSDPYLLGYLPFSLSVNGFLFDRNYQDWNEQRLGGRAALGYRITPDLSLSVGFTGQNVTVYDIRPNNIPEVNAMKGDHDLWSGEVKLSYFSLDHPFDPTEGYTVELTYNQVFGSYDYPRGMAEFRKYFLLSQRADNSGRHTLATIFNLGVSGSDTPVFENFFAGGYATLRGFQFRGANPHINGIQVGGQFQFLGSVEYKFPLTADDMLKGVVFFDYGTVEQDVRFDADNFRASPGVGLRVNVPALGPAPLAFDFGFPIMEAAGDEKQVFSFYMGFNR